MKYYMLLVLPLICGAVVLSGYLIFMNTDGFSTFFIIERWFSRLLAFSGSIVAALAFGRKEPLQRAWLLIAASWLCFIVLDSVPNLGLGPGETFMSSSLARGLLGLIANSLYIIGLWFLVRTWQSIYFRARGSNKNKWVAILAAVILIVLIIGPAIRFDFMRLIDGNYGAFFGLVANIADGFSLLLIAPLMLTAFLLRGGLASWPYWLLTLSQCSWLLLDGLLFSGTSLGFSDLFVQIGGEVLRCLASAFLFLAGWTQRLVAKHIS